jgi:hypothetical protein
MWNLRTIAIIPPGGQYRYQPMPDENVTSVEQRHRIAAAQLAAVGCRQLQA